MSALEPQSTGPALVTFDRVTKRYGEGRPALDGASFSIARSEFVLLTGPSGAGKSTLLRLVAALERPTSGSIVVAGEDLARIRRRALPFLRRSIGIVLQDLMLLADRSVLDNVTLPALASGLSGHDARGGHGPRSPAAIGPESRSARPNALSGGGAATCRAGPGDREPSRADPGRRTHRAPRRSISRTTAAARAIRRRWGHGHRRDAW
jgi:ABC-type ATPase involved in cell division